MPAAMAANVRTEVSRRELALLALGACLIAVVMTWPLVLNLRTDISRDLGDPLVQSWEVAWDGYALPISRCTSSSPTSSGRCTTPSPSPMRWQAMHPRA